MLRNHKNTKYNNAQTKNLKKNYFIILCMLIKTRIIVEIIILYNYLIIYIVNSSIKLKQCS